MLSRILRRLEITKDDLLEVSIGCAIMAFRVINIHEPSQIAEDEVLGLGLLLEKVFGLNLVYTSVILDGLCYALGFPILGGPFLKRSAAATLTFSIFCGIFNQVRSVLPGLSQLSLLTAIAGGIFIGCSCRTAITVGGCAGGDDALAMVISKKTEWPIARVYLLTDFVVLALSLTYISPGRLVSSFLITLVSPYLAGQSEIKIKIPAWQVSQEVLEKSA